MAKQRITGTQVYYSLETKKQVLELAKEESRSESGMAKVLIEQQLAYLKKK